jgi:hypothetical protein
MAGMRALTLILLATAAGSTHGQTIEQRAAEVLNTLASPPTVETVIDRGTTVVGRQLNPVPASPQVIPAPAARTLAIQPVQTSSDGDGGELPAIDTRGTVFVDDPRGTAFMNDARGIGLTGAPAWLPNAKGPAVPGLVTRSISSGRAVRGTSNVVTVPRSASSAGDSNP